MSAPIDKQARHPTEAHRQADELLDQIGELEAKLTVARNVYLAEIELMSARLKDRIGPIKLNQEKLKKTLEKLMKTSRFVLFDGTDRVDLDNGALLFAIEDRVRRAKDMLARLEETGAEDSAFIVTRAVNWDYLETWTDERLLEVGTERKREEKFSWELKCTAEAQRGKK